MTKGGQAVDFLSILDIFGNVFGIVSDTLGLFSGLWGFGSSLANFISWLVGLFV